MTAKLNMDSIMGKAEILIEALPYIRRFSGKVFIVKYGGSAMEVPELKAKVIEDIALLKLIGIHPIVVHGGGKEITRWCNKTGITSRFIDGLRVTDAETLRITEMVLYSINQELVSLLGNNGIRAIGLSGRDAKLLHASRRVVQGKDIGFVGRVESVDTDVIRTMLAGGLVPVISPIGVDEDGQGYNINADEVACEVAIALKANKLAFLTDTDGLYEDFSDPDTLISEIYLSEAKKMLASDAVSGGMLPKLYNCTRAVEGGVSRVHIINGEVAHCLLLEFFSDRGVGTAILGEEEKKYYHD